MIQYQREVTDELASLYGHHQYERSTIGDP